MARESTTLTVVALITRLKVSMYSQDQGPVYYLVTRRALRRSTDPSVFGPEYLFGAHSVDVGRVRYQNPSAIIL